MKISAMIKQLQALKKAHGDIPGVIEVANTDKSPVAYEMKAVGELSVEQRAGHGLSVAFLV